MENARSPFRRLTVTIQAAKIGHEPRKIGETRHWRTLLKKKTRTFSAADAMGCTRPKEG